MKKLGVTLVLVPLTALAALGLTACGGGSNGGDEDTLNGAYSGFPDYLDPQLSYSAEGWTAMYNTYIPLLTYAHAEGDAGSKVIPGLAESLPEISDDGRTYTLRLREGLKYSDGRPVKASDFESSIERMFKLNSAGTFFYSGIVGAEELAETRQGDLAGIETDDASGEITIELTEPRGTFTNELALPFAAPVPADTPDKDQTSNPPPATGPYEITSATRGRGWTYARNPQWDANNAELMPDLPGGHVENIEIDVIRNAQTQVNDVEAGRIDWIFDPPPPDRYAAVKDKYEGTQFRVEPTISTYYFWMNTRRPPFDDVRVRQAVNYAVDPEALVRIYSGQLEPTQQILPPGMPGHEKFELYPHDMAKARQLIREADPADTDVTVWTITEAPNEEAASYYQDVLDKLGFDAELKTLGPDNYFGVIGNDSTPELDTGWGSWFQDYPHPGSFLEPMLSGEVLGPTGNTNLSRTDIPSLDRELSKLATEQLGPEQEAAYAELDKEFMETAPMAPYGNRVLALFVSERVELDDVIWNPTFSADLTSFRFK